MRTNIHTSGHNTYLKKKKKKKKIIFKILSSKKRKTNKNDNKTKQNKTFNQLRNHDPKVTQVYNVHSHENGSTSFAKN